MAEEIPYMSLLCGNDTISIGSEKRRLLSAIGDRFGEIEEERFDTDQQDLGSFVERIITPSLFQTTRVFFIRHVQQFSAEEFAILKSAMGYSVPDGFVIIEADESDIKKGEKKALTSFKRSLSAKAKKNPDKFLVKTFLRPKDYKIAEWLVANLPRLLQRRIGKKDAEYFVDLVGYDFDTIFSEIQKIDLYLPEKKPVDRAIIREIIEGSRSMNSFELAAALGRRDCARALTIVDSLFSVNFYAPPCIAALFRHFWALFKIRILAREKPAVVSGFLEAIKTYNRSVQNRLGMEIGIAAGILSEGQEGRLFPALIKSGIVQQSENFTLQELKERLFLLREYDHGVKTGSVDTTKRTFQILCYRIAQCATQAVK